MAIMGILPVMEQSWTHRGNIMGISVEQARTYRVKLIIGIIYGHILEISLEQSDLSWKHRGNIIGISWTYLLKHHGNMTAIS